ncbi:MAG: serine/threonine-protein kinase [Gemmatimonadota bacterium]|nr:serine/threonine-protein kinase [Gemmatimonadota bacterium]
MTATDTILEELTPLLAGQYTFERELGRGGMGVVYLAREIRLDRLVAVKVLPPHLASQPMVRERFLREARTAAQLSHPSIVPIYRAEEIGGYAFFAMAFIDGDNLAERVRDRGPLPAAEVVRVMRESAWARSTARRTMAASPPSYRTNRDYFEASANFLSRARSTSSFFLACGMMSGLSS